MPTMTFEELGYDLRKFIDSNKLNNLILMGHSFGGRKIFGYL